jgi:alkylated DNA repair dioxygenase AlkB
MMPHAQLKLFEQPRKLPDGFRYQPEMLSRSEERTLVSHIALLPFKQFEFRGYRGKRRVVSFGWRYDFNGGGLQRTEDIPAFLLPLRERAASLARMSPQRLQHVLVTEYSPGAGIGWHKDRPVFGEVVGISLMSPCTFRLRRSLREGWERISLDAQPRSAYLLAGEARTTWEHSIPAVDQLRYSVTFRNLKDDEAPA